MPEIAFDVHDNLDQKSEIFEELLETPQLCMLLNPHLSQKQIGNLSNAFYVVPIEHEGKQRFAVICGFYRQENAPEPQIYDMWHEDAEDNGGITEE